MNRDFSKSEMISAILAILPNCNPDKLWKYSKEEIKAILKFIRNQKGLEL